MVDCTIRCNGVPEHYPPPGQKWLLTRAEPIRIYQEGWTNVQKYNMCMKMKCCTMTGRIEFGEIFGHCLPEGLLSNREGP